MQPLPLQESVGLLYLYTERLQHWMRGRKADRVVATSEAREMTGAR